MGDIKANLKKVYNFIEKYIYVFAPILALILFLILAKMNDIAPFGNKTVAWCDLEQQGIPLLNQLKDILEGKQSLFGNLSAGGMSYFGVFFFYIASPFSFLVVFVDKAYMASFVNIIIMLKMATSAFTFSFYLKKKYKNLDGIIILALSIFYSFSGYLMMYYQTLTWLDMIYLFPILMLSIDMLLDKGKMIPYIIFMVLTVCINYYIGVMCVFLVIFYVGFKLFYYRNKKDNIKDVSFKFILSSFIALLISMAIIIPSFIDYFASSRTISIKESLEESWVITPYETAIPLVLGTSILLPFLFIKEEREEKLIKLILLLVMSIPLIIDPINKMWHYGSYQGFPCRFAFMNIFLLLDIIGMVLQNVYDEKINIKVITKWLIGSGIAGLFIVFSFIFEYLYTKNNMSSLERYTHSLWGNSTSFEALLRYYSVILIVVLVIFLLHKIKVIPKKGLGISFLCLAIIEATFSFKVYMVSASRETTYYENYYEIVNVIDDTSYYNVKTNVKIRNVNDLGGAGYNNFGHYTSLTPKGYMDALKKMGYSSYWMEVSTYGGTILNDALLLNKYTIKTGSSLDAKYNTKHYGIYENKVLPLGLVTTNDLTDYETLGEGSRGLMQQNIAKALFNDESIVNVYDKYSSLTNLADYSNDTNIKYSINNLSSPGTIRYVINVGNRERLYFEAFDKYTNALSQSINDCISIKVNNITKNSKYPTQSYNGFVDLGEYENQTVTIDVILNKSIACSSLSIFGIDTAKYNNLVDSDINHADISYTNKGFSGTYNAEEESYMFLPIAYTKDVVCKINNHKVDVYRVFDGFVAIKLNKGINNISISYEKAGLIPGIFISLLGVGLLISYFVLRDRKRLDIIFENDKIKKVSYYLIIILAIGLFLALYLLPLMINILSYIR